MQCSLLWRWLSYSWMCCVEPRMLFILISLFQKLEWCLIVNHQLSELIQEKCLEKAPLQLHLLNIMAGRTHGWYKVNLSFWFASPRQEDGSILPAQDWQKNSANIQPILLGQYHICTEKFCCLFHRYQTLAVATDANTKEDIGNKKVSGKKLTVSLREMQKLHIYLYIITSK